MLCLKWNNVRNREPGYYEPRVIYNKYNVLFIKKKKKKNSRYSHYVIIYVMWNDLFRGQLITVEEK